jgi:hypothetical protein
MTVETADPMVSEEEALEAIPPVSDLRADDALALMKEYDQKLRSLIGRLRRLDASGKPSATGAGGEIRAPWLVPKSRPGPGELDAPGDIPLTRAELVSRIRTIFFPAEDLARYASALINHSRVDQVTNLELRLRSAELESTLELASVVNTEHLALKAKGRA